MKTASTIDTRHLASVHDLVAYVASLDGDIRTDEADPIFDHPTVVVGERLGLMKISLTGSALDRSASIGLSPKKKPGVISRLRSLFVRLTPQAPV